MFERGQLAEVTWTPGTGVSHAERCSDVMDRFRDCNLAHVALTDAITAWDTAGSWCASGATSPPSWLRAHLGVSHATAMGMILRSRRLRSHPAVGEAVHEGRLCADQADLILAALVGRDTHAERDVATLVDQVARLAFADGHRVLQHWKALVDAETAPDPTGDPDPVPAEFHVSPGLDGQFQLHGHLDPIGGATITAALDSAMELQRAGEDGPRDARSAGQKRADALLLIVGFFVDHHTTRPTSSGVRPHVTISVDLDVVALRTPGLADAGRIRTGMAASDARQVCCDANITRIVTLGRSEILDVGRATRVWPTATRTAIVRRDHHCRHPGCDTPAWFCEVHHIQHWTNNGPTSVANGALFCRRHHHYQHHGWTCTGDANSTLTFTSPTRDTYTARPPP